jgi:hypothetical protein
LPTCYAPVRRAPSVLLRTRTRLACVKHAASVRSEPGSNSRLKLVAWAKKMPGFASRPACPSELLSLDLTQTIRARKGRMVSNGFWHIVSVVKERDPPVQQKGTSTAQGEYDGMDVYVNRRLKISTGSAASRRSEFQDVGCWGQVARERGPGPWVRISAGLREAMKLALRALFEREEA